jgi:hypothetical protein
MIRLNELTIINIKQEMVFSYLVEANEDIVSDVGNKTLLFIKSSTVYFERYLKVFSNKTGRTFSIIV